MEPIHRRLPIGFRFRPTDYEMSHYFLTKKALGQTMKARTIPEECPDIFSRHPRALPGYPLEEHWYYYCRKVDNQDTTNSHNIWILISEGTNVLDKSNNGQVVGIKRSFKLAEHEQEKEESYDILLSDEEEEETPKYNWFMDEFSLPLTIADTDLVLCHVFRKKIKPEIVDLPIIESDSEEEEEEEESVVAESLNLVEEKDGSVLPPSPSPP
ncbi:hypothetical protein AALP_AA6G321900 [Arabis alpina]|uniref:NAC domain-containing protein n=1 Tax=Arabis alpina TaxID=50452 RepID=A0A087GT30_ARAAL|nr:hypothetical protein AALP_AA6G321900 [Arabis alpina]